MGQMKEEPIKESVNIKGRKTYRVDDTLKVSGISKNRNTKEEFDNGIIEGVKQITIKTAKKVDDVGKFQKETRDLNELQENFHARKELMEEQDVYIDHDISDINHFVKRLTEEI